MPDACGDVLSEYPQELSYGLRMMEVSGQLWDHENEQWIDDAAEVYVR